MTSNSQIQPQISYKEIQDTYIRQNFLNLIDYFTNQNQLLNFKFYELVVSAAVTNYKLSHQLGFQPVDIIVTQVTGSGSVSFNLGLSDNKFLNITTSGSCRVRFFVGKYWDQSSNVTQKSTDVMTFNASGSVSVVSATKKQIIKNNYSVQLTDGALFFDCTNGPIQVTLPATNLADQLNIFVEKIDSTSNKVTINTNSPSGELIRSISSLTFSAQWASANLFCLKPNWYY